MFRNMRRFKQQVSDSECEAILKSARRGVLAVQGDDGYPYAVPLDFVYENGKIYFHSAMEGHKIDAIRRCDKASFCVLNEGQQEPGEWWYHFISVIAFGRVSFIEDADEAIDKLRLLGMKYIPTAEERENDISKHAARATCLAFTVEHMTGKRVNEK